jgi:hypothetical protein
MHSDLTREVQLAVGELLRLAWSNSGKQWVDFGLTYFEDRYVENKSRKKTDRDTKLIWPKTAITGAFASRLIEYCRTAKGLDVPKPLQDRLGLLWSPKHHESAIPGSEKPAGSRRETDDDERGFILALGLGTNAAGESIAQFEGSYLHFALSDEGLVVTTRCTLQDKRDRDSAPVYDTRRWYDEFGEVVSKGVYFAGEKNLYLLASPKGRLDVRLSIFSVMWPGRKQEVVRGFALAVNPQSTIVATRAVLLRAEFLNPAVAEDLWRIPAPVTSFEQIRDFREVDGNRLPENQFAEIGEYLTGAEMGDPIGLMTLPAPNF